jgi:hypothetical protein
MACRHCNKPGYAVARGLCSGCYYSDVRALYPIVPLPRNHHGLGINNTEPPPPPHPTRAVPGTPEKLMVMAWRAANGYAVFHPEDYKDTTNEWEYL